MSTLCNELEQQIEKAFNYRGNVTLAFKDGRTLDAFIYNREFSNPKLTTDSFVEVFLAGSGESQRFAIADLQSVALTGEDHAAGKSYADWLEKQKGKDTHA